MPQSSPTFTASSKPDVHLCADIGGTNARLALAEVGPGSHVSIMAVERYLASETGSLAATLERFAAQFPELWARGVRSACFGVAGPVAGGQVHMTNLDWVIDEREVSQMLGGVPAKVINDFEAAARGVDAMSDDDLACLQPGPVKHPAHQLVIGAGTGLGVAWRLQMPGQAPGRRRVFPGEGGHMAFAPVSEVQDRCLARMRREMGGAVSVEHVVSGPGLVRLHAAIAQDLGVAPQALDGVTAKDVMERATSGQDAVAEQALDEFLLAYGAVTGSLALTLMARGGVYLAGGLAARWPQCLQQGAFMRGFRLTGPYQALLSSWPVHIVLSPDLGLLGAALAACEELCDGG